MKKILKHLITALLIIMFFFPSNSISANAATFPSFYFCSTNAFDDYETEVYATKGKDYWIRMHWYSQFTYEGYEMIIYDPSGKKIAKSSSTWENQNIIRHISVKWNTKGLECGKYTVEVTQKFYSLYRWNEGPKKRSLTIYLEPANKKPAKVTDWLVNGESPTSMTVTYVLPASAKKCEIQYSTDKSFKTGVKKKITTETTKIKINKLKRGKTYYIRLRGINGKSKGSWSAKKKLKLSKY